MYIPMGAPQCVLAPAPPPSAVPVPAAAALPLHLPAHVAPPTGVAGDPVVAVRYSPAGQLLADCGARSVRLWAGQPLTLLSTYTRSEADVAHSGANAHLVWRRCGTRLAIATTRGHLLFVHVEPPAEKEDGLPPGAGPGRVQVPLAARTGQPIAGARWAAPAFRLRPAATSPGQAATATMAHAVAAVLARDDGVMVATTAGVLERVPWDATYFDAATAIVLPQYVPTPSPEADDATCIGR